ncbi:MAG TPA: hypothetical protein VJR47_18200 [Stellaceae bacterium]|nr:hypothetical protein [Stellaceae bacterium]
MTSGNVEIAFEGKTYSARYEVNGKPGQETLTVESSFDTTTAPLGDTPAAMLATVILREQVRWALRSGMKL